LTAVGRVVAGDGQVHLIEAGQRRLLLPPERDEIARLFD